MRAVCATVMAALMLTACASSHESTVVETTGIETMTPPDPMMRPCPIPESAVNVDDEDDVLEAYPDVLLNLSVCRARIEAIREWSDRHDE